MPVKSYLIKGAVICESAHPERKDIYVEDGVIHQIGEALTIAPGTEVLDVQGARVSAGWFDLRCRLSDPGFEEREDLFSGTLAAAAGGFTDIACLPDTKPVIDSKSQIDYILSSTRNAVARVHPLGTASIKLEGKELSEMYDMKMAGAVAFSNGDYPVADAGYLLRAMLYSKPFGGLMMVHAEDISLSKHGLVNESRNTVNTGLKTAPRMAESTAVQTYIEVAAYAGTRLHISHVSTRESVEHIRSAKKRGIEVTCDVSIIHLILNDLEYSKFDSNYKISPPLRSEEDRLALVAGVNDGTIDAIVTDHAPLNPELKEVEFDYATPGMTGFQTFYPLYNQYLSDQISEKIFLERITVGPRKVLNLNSIAISPGQEAVMTIFDPGCTWQFNATSNLSKSNNNPYFGETLQGKILYTIHKNKIFKNTF